MHKHSKRFVARWQLIVSESLLVQEYERVEAMLAQKQAVQILERKSHHFAQ